MNLIEKLNWRYATKRMNGNSLPEDKLNNILEAIRLSASSYGLQPYHILVVSNPETKEKIHQEACIQPQIIECSHLLVFASWNEIGNKEVNDYMENIASTRAISTESINPFANRITGTLEVQTPEQIKAWTAKQAYIALGFGLVAAAIEDVDACPMEGFDADKMDEALSLKERNLHATVIMTLGYRDTKTDHLAGMKKVRKNKEELFSIID